MPALPPVAGVIKIAIQGTIGPYKWAMIMHAQYSGGPPDAADLTTFAAALEASWSTNIKSFFCSDIYLTEINVTDLSSTSGANGLWSGSVVGTGSGTFNTANASVLATYPSSYRYRGGHPRSYWPPFAAGQLSDSAHWSSANLAAFQTAAEVFLGLLYTSTYTTMTLAGQCAVSYVYTPVGGSPGTRRTTPLVMPITRNSVSFPTEVASQRRRIGRK
jgi:hypothetical protein